MPWHVVKMTFNFLPLPYSNSVDIKISVPFSSFQPLTALAAVVALLSKLHDQNTQETTEDFST